MRRLIEQLEEEVKIKLAKGVRGIESALLKAGFKIREAPRATYTHRGELVHNATTTGRGQLEVKRYAGWDYVVSAGLRSTGIPNDVDRQAARELSAKAQEALDKAGYQTSRERSDISFVVKGKIPE